MAKIRKAISDNERVNIRKLSRIQDGTSIYKKYRAAEHLHENAKVRSGGRVSEICGPRYQYLDNELPPNRPGYRHRKTPFRDLEDTLALWIEQQRQNGVALNGRILRARADELWYTQFSPQQDRGSVDSPFDEKWLRKFKNRYNVLFRQILRVERTTASNVGARKDTQEAQGQGEAANVQEMQRAQKTPSGEKLFEGEYASRSQTNQNPRVSPQQALLNSLLLSGTVSLIREPYAFTVTILSAPLVQPGQWLQGPLSLRFHPETLSLATLEPTDATTVETLMSSLREGGNHVRLSERQRNHLNLQAISLYHDRKPDEALQILAFISASEFHGWLHISDIESLNARARAVCNELALRINKGQFLMARPIAEAIYDELASTIGACMTLKLQAGLFCALLAIHAGECDAAEFMLQGIIQAALTTRGIAHPLTLEALSLHACALRDQKKFSASARLAAAVEDCAAMAPFCVTHINDRAARCIISAKICSAQQSYHDALAILKHGRDLSLTSGVQDNLLELQLELNLAGVLYYLKRLDEAFECAQSAVATASFLYSNSDIVYGDAVFNLAHITLSQAKSYEGRGMIPESLERFTNAAWYFHDATRVYSVIFGDFHQRTVDVASLANDSELRYRLLADDTIEA